MNKSLIIQTCILTIILLIGYFTFLSYTEDDLLKNFKVKGTYISFIMNIVRVGFGISMILSFPLMIWEARHNLDVLLFTSSKSSNKKRKKYSFKRFMLLNVLLLILHTLRLCGNAPQGARKPPTASRRPNMVYFNKKVGF